MPHIYGVDGVGPGVDGAAAKFVESVAVIAREVAAKHAADVDAKGRFPVETIDALAKQGLLGLCVAKEFGGAGQGPRAFVAAVEELAQACGSSAMVFVMHVTAAQQIAASTTLAARAEILRAIAAGTHLTTLALSEKGSRSQFWAPVSKLVAKNGAHVTSAFKSFVTAAGHADSYVSSAQKPGAASPLESTLYLLRKGSAGARVAGRFDGVGLRGNDSAPVTIEDLRVEGADLVTPHGEGAAGMLQVVLPWFGVGSAAMANGLGRAALAATQTHLAGTGFEHDGTKLRDLAVLRARLARMSVTNDASRALLGHTLGHLEHPSDATPLYVLESRAAAIAAAIDVTDQAMQTCGGAAFSKQLPLERIFRDARAGSVMAPTLDHLHDFIGKALTGLPLFG